jgi:hypothetical protein
MVMNGELEGMWKEAVSTSVRRGWGEKKNLQQRLPNSGPIFELGTAAYETGEQVTTSQRLGTYVFTNIYPVLIILSHRLHIPSSPFKD